MKYPAQGESSGRGARGDESPPPLNRAELPVASAAARDLRPEELRVLLVAENCSRRGGGEAVIAYHYFRVLRARGQDVYLLTHERCRSELHVTFPDDHDRLLFTEDHKLHRLLHRVGRRLPERLHRATTGFLSLMFSHFLQRRVIRRMVAERGIQVVHQPTPVSPAQPSLIFAVGAPVVIGPLNGGINYPPGFRDREHALDRLAALWGRRLSHALNWFLPGKRDAALILVSNARTRAALPRCVRGEVVELVENGVDLSCWQPPPRRQRAPDDRLRCVFVGRFVNWKAVDLLLAAWRRLPAELGAELEIIGDGPLRGELEATCRELGLEGSVRFSGWLDQPQCWRRLCASDVLVLPSLLECGGAVVLEAMSAELAVVASNWGGPTDYLDPSCGCLVETRSPEEFVAGLAAAIIELARAPRRCAEMGAAGRARVLQFYDWERKIDAMLAHYHRVVTGRPAPPAAPALLLPASRAVDPLPCEGGGPR